MAFSQRQIRALCRNIDRRNIRTRQNNGRELSYIEGWYAITQANRIFGFGGWDRETIESRCVLAREVRGTFHAVYVSKVRITVRANGETVVREGYGTGEGRGASAGETHEIALKGAETDATKRALATFGKPFGLALHSNGPVVRELPSAHRANQMSRELAIAQVASGMRPQPHNPRSSPAPELSDPATWPSTEFAGSASGSSSNATRPTQSHTDAEGNSVRPEANHDRLDYSALPIGRISRRRDKAHLKLVASRPCLVCGRSPSDPHHLRFAQPMALGTKVSDEFTVPLCRTHHRELHRANDEVAWWTKIGLDPLPVARRLWELRKEMVQIEELPPEGSAPELLSDRTR